MAIQPWKMSGMQVIDFEPHAWYLLDNGDALYLDVHCSHSVLDYSVLIELNSQETAAFRSRGRSFIGQLAEDINYSAPAARESHSPFKLRDLIRARAPQSDTAHAAIMAFNAARERG